MYWGHVFCYLIPPPPPPTVGQQVELIKKYFGLNVRISCGERGYIWKKLKFQKNLLKISFQQNFEFQNRLNGSKVIIFSLPCTKKKFKNDQDVCWLEHDYMEMKIWLSETSPIIISTWPLKLAHCAPPSLEFGTPNGISLCYLCQSVTITLVDQNLSSPPKSASPVHFNIK